MNFCQPHLRTAADYVSIVIAGLLAVTGLDCCGGAAVAQVENSEPRFSADQLEFFETRIRPVLIDHCLECHTGDEPENNLLLDSRAAILRGGASGVAAVAGEPSESLLVQALAHTGDYDMPPSGKLSDEVITDFRNWVAAGLPWTPAASLQKLTSRELIEKHRQTHWAFQPVVRPAILDKSLHDVSLSKTVAADTSGLLSPVDQIVRAQLSTNSLEPSPLADRRTLIRRASFDLLGLPPTFAEVQAFIDDDATDAYERLIDRLLDSPRYGERWARHWLDVARYADTSGYLLDGADNRYPFAFTYRDYVIDAFNRDTPYDQFIREQLAADYLPLPEDKRTLAALGFITVGRKYLAAPDTIDDQVDVVTRGLMGLTVSCARCHDHKYDAIPTEDYYSLYSVFSNNYLPSELPLIGDRQSIAAHQAFLEDVERLKDEVKQFQQIEHRKLLKHVRQHATDYLARVWWAADPSLGKLEPETHPFIKLADHEVRPEVLHNFRKYWADILETSPNVALPVQHLISRSADEFPGAVDIEIARLRDLEPNGISGELPNLLQPILESLKTELVQEAMTAEAVDTAKAELVRRMLGWVTETMQEFKPILAGQADANSFDAEQFSPDNRLLARPLFRPGSPLLAKFETIDSYLDLPAQKTIAKLRDAVKRRDSEAPQGIRRAMVLRDDEPLVDVQVMIRGNVNRLGDVAPRRFVELLSKPGEPRKVFTERSGRLELANEIASRDNPLTARVMVNRVWMHHFSQPLVDTPSDFGIRCEEPVQRDLLDYLAYDFMEHGWSLKHLHRRIMLSQTYQQSSDDRAQYRKVDPENRLLWRMNRRRLEFEPLRDSILKVAGTLDETLFGKPVDLLAKPFSDRRTVYGFIDRQDLPGLYRIFDLASPDQSAARRIRTSVPQQSLFMLNSPFMLQKSGQLLQNLDGLKEADTEERITLLYRHLFQREPDARELEIGASFIEHGIPESDEQQISVWHRYVQLLLCTNEFEFID